MSKIEQSSKWFALHVRSRHEKSVYAQLAAKQQQAFLPMAASQNKWADRMKEVWLPLFPGYVFCRFEPSAKSTILATSGIIDLVRVGCEPAVIDDADMEAVHRIVHSQLQAQSHKQLVRGQQVTINQGPLTGLTGTLMQLRNASRLLVNVEMLCRSVSVEINHDWILPYHLSQPVFSQTPHLN